MFEEEFEIIAHKFVIIEEFLSSLKISNKNYISNPGIYVFLNKESVIKVGRSLSNSRKRALTHISANTNIDSFNMIDMPSDINSKVLLFIVRNNEDYHWVAAIEIYLEKSLNPLIKTKRH